MKVGEKVKIISRTEKSDLTGTITRVSWRGAAGSHCSFLYRVHVALDNGDKREFDPLQLEVIDD